MAKKRIEVEKTIEQPTTGYFVILPFKDNKIYGNESYSIGDDVSHFDTERLERAVERGLVELKTEID